MANGTHRQSGARFITCSLVAFVCIGEWAEQRRDAYVSDWNVSTSLCRVLRAVKYLHTLRSTTHHSARLHTIARRALVKSDSFQFFFRSFSLFQFFFSLFSSSLWFFFFFFFRPILSLVRVRNGPSSGSVCTKETNDQWRLNVCWTYYVCMRGNAATARSNATDASAHRCRLRCAVLCCAVRCVWIYIYAPIPETPSHHAKCYYYILSVCSGYDLCA